jgi:Uma2 family endonuclease
MSISTAKRFTIAEYHRLAELGFFEEDNRVELIKGEIVQMAAKGTPIQFVRHFCFGS